MICTVLVTSASVSKLLKLTTLSSTVANTEQVTLLDSNSGFNTDKVVINL